MIFKDILLELRAIRFGQELLLKHLAGANYNLLQLAQRADSNLALAELRRRGPRDHTAMIHKNEERLEAKELLELGGNDTELMFRYFQENFGDEAAAQVRNYYEQEILRGKHDAYPVKEK